MCCTSPSKWRSHQEDNDVRLNYNCNVWKGKQWGSEEKNQRSVPYFTGHAYLSILDLITCIYK